MRRAYRSDDDRFSEYFERDEFGRLRELKEFTTTDLDRHINLNPHYSDRKYQQGKTQTVFGTEDKALDYIYSDRCWQWDYEKAQSAAKTACEKTTVNTGRWVQTFLSEFFGKEIELKHIVVGCNSFSGYAYWAAGFKVKQ